MTQSDLKTLIDKGADAGTIWAGVQNHVSQQIDAAKQEAFDAHAKNLADAIAAKEAAENALAEKNAEVAAGLAAIHTIVANPEIDTERGMIEFLNEATKDERTKQREAKLAQITALQAEVDSLK